MNDKIKPNVTDAQPQAQADAGENITGRSVFVTETVGAGVSVRTAFLAEDGRLLDMPAVFPDLMYAMSQLDELRQHISRRFTEAAQIGNQIIAQQIENNRAQAQAAASTAVGQDEPTQIETKSTLTAKGVAKDSSKESAKEAKSVSA